MAGSSIFSIRNFHFNVMYIVLFALFFYFETKTFFKLGKINLFSPLFWKRKNIQNVGY